MGSECGLAVIYCGVSDADDDLGLGNCRNIFACVHIDTNSVYMIS